MFLNQRIRPIFLYEPDKGPADPPAPTIPPTVAAEKIEFTPAQQAHLDKLLGERSERAGDAAVTKLLKSLGVEKPDDVKTQLAEFAKLRDSQLSEQEKATKALEAKAARVTELEAQVAVIEDLKKEKEKYAEAIKAQLKTLKEGLPEHILKLVNKLDLPDQLEYIAENAATLNKKSDPIPRTPSPANPQALSEAEQTAARNAHAQSVRSW